MFAVIKIGINNGSIEAFGPFTDRRNARKAQEWHTVNGMYHAEVVPLTRVVEGPKAVTRDSV